MSLILLEFWPLDSSTKELRVLSPDERFFSPCGIRFLLNCSATWVHPGPAASAPTLLNTGLHGTLLMGRTSGFWLNGGVDKLSPSPPPALLRALPYAGLLKLKDHLLSTMPNVPSVIQLLPHLPGLALFVSCPKF